MSGSINKRIEQAINDAKKISENPISAYLQNLKTTEGTPAVYDAVIRQSMTKYRIPEYIQEQILDGDGA